MRVVVAPDKFAGTLSAADAASALSEGWLRARPDDDVVSIPMADGGEGTLAVVEASVAGCQRVPVDVADARGLARTGHWLRLPDGRGLIEAAEACGLSQLGPDRRDPLEATSYGVGQLVASAVHARVTRIVVGLGGSATVDGGAGLAIAMGHRLLRADGNGVKVGTRYLPDLVRIEPAPAPDVAIEVAVDVTTPLLGPGGAVEVFAPQKGAAPEDLPVLEEALRTFADIVERDVPGGPWRELPGSGAAGGLGFALAAFCGARLVPGAEAVARLVGLADAVAGAGVVLTGEGKLDAQTAQGKTPAYVARLAADAGATVYAVAGIVEAGAEQLFDGHRDLGPQGLDRPFELVADRAEQLARGHP